MKSIRLTSVFTWCLLMCVTASVDASPIAHWGFDETSGTTAFDSVGSVDGTLTGGVAFTITGGVIGGAIEITDGYVTMGDFFDPTSTFSIHAWVKTNVGDLTPMMPVSKHQSGNASGYILSINNIGDGGTIANKAGFYSADSPIYDTAAGGPNVNDGEWHQLVGVYDNGVTSIFVDGSLADNGAAGFAGNGASFLIGGLVVGGSPTNAFSGLIDEVSVYDYALSESHVQTLYNSYASIPEPSTFLLLSMGLGAIAVSGIKRKYQRRRHTLV